MAGRIYLSSAWKKCEYTNFNEAPNNPQGQTYTDSSPGLTTSGFSVTNGVSLQGVFIHLMTTSNGAATFTVSLEENTGSWVQKAVTAAMALSALPTQPSSPLIYIAFGTPYTGTTNQFRIKLNGVAGLYWYRSNTAGDYAVALVGAGDDGTAPASGDTVLVSNAETLTINSAMTLSPTAAGSGSIVVGYNAVLSLPNPGSPYTLALQTGHIFLASDLARLLIGTSGTRVQAAGVTISTTAAANDMFFILQFQYITGLVYVEIYGNVTTAMRLTTSQADNSGQKVIHTVEDIPVSWLTTDTITLGSKDTTSNDTATYTMSGGIGTKQVTTNTNLDVKSLANGSLWNLTEAQRNCGVILTSTNQQYLAAYGGTLNHMIFDGVYAYKISPIWPHDSATGSTAAHQIKNSMFYSWTNYMIIYDDGYGGIQMSNVHLISGGVSVYTFCTGNNATVTGLYGKNMSTGISDLTWGGIKGNNNVMTGICLAHGNWTVSGAGNNLTNFRLIGGYLYPFGGGPLFLTNFSQERSGSYGIYIENSAVKLYGGNVGSGATNATNDIYVKTGTFPFLTGLSTSIGTKDVGNETAGGPGNGEFTGSFIRLNNYNGVAGDNRSWYRQGHFYSNNSKLDAYTDLTTDTLTNIYNISSDTIAGMKVRIAVGCKIGNAAYYAGVYTAPKLNVDYDSGSTDTQTAANNTNQQTLTSVISPATSNNPVYIRLTQKSDASVANSKVTWGDLVFASGAFPYSKQTYTKALTATTDDIIYNIPSGTNDPFVTTTNGATVAGWAGITFNHGTQTITINAQKSGGSDWTLADLYDRCLYEYYDQNMAYDKFFDTIDGINYTSTYNITVDGVLLSGSGKTLDLGSQTFSAINGGSTTAIVTDVNGTLVSVSITSVIVGALWEVYKTSDGTTLGSGTAAGTTVAFNFQHVVDVGVTWITRKFGYLESKGTGTITSNGFSVQASPVVDPNYATYAAGISSDFTINATTGAIAHASGTTVYTVKDLYNYQMDYMANAARMQKTLKISAQTPFDFTLINSATISDADHAYLKSGSITEAAGDTLWANVYTVGTIAAGNLYIYQNGSEYTKFWGNGNVDILLKVKTSGTLIDSGYVTLFSREYSYTYDVYKADLSNGGRTAVSLTTAADSNNTTLEATIAGWSDITVTVGAVSKDIGDGAGAQPYSVTVDAGGHAIKDVYERLKYITEEGQAGEAYRYVNATWTEVKTSPYGSFAGGVAFFARGIWVENVATGDALNYIVIDNNGSTHQIPTPPVQLSGTGIIDGSRIQVYDVDDATELDNAVISGTTYTYEYDFATIGGHTLRIRLAYTDGVTAKAFWTTTVIAGASGASFIASQVDDSTYNSNGIDGSGRSEFSISGTTIEIFIDQGSGSDTIPAAYNWWAYLMTTESGIRDQTFSNFTAIDTAHYKFLNGQKFKNISATPLLLTGAVVKDGDGAVTTCVDTTGENIYILPANVETYAINTGSGLTTAEHDQLMAIPTSGSLTPEQETQLMATLTTAKFIGLK